MSTIMLMIQRKIDGGPPECIPQGRPGGIPPHRTLKAGHTAVGKLVSLLELHTLIQTQQISLLKPEIEASFVVVQSIHVKRWPEREEARYRGWYLADDQCFLLSQTELRAEAMSGGIKSRIHCGRCTMASKLMRKLLSRTCGALLDSYSPEVALLFVML
jgi:hypothetical protein